MEGRTRGGGTDGKGGMWKVGEMWELGNSVLLVGGQTPLGYGGGRK